uniref:Uncharacterized protein n=1 Tax=Oryza barthii TaxID=65489 RepID=A0A0D3FV37_9ORYZ
MWTGVQQHIMIAAIYTVFYYSLYKGMVCTELISFLLKTEVARSKGRVALTTNMVLGGTVTDDASDEWLVLDQKVNSYPTNRGFTAIGTGGDDFVQSMVVAVESVLQEPIPKGQVSHKLSSRGKYVSVKIGPIRVVSSEQVQAVYRAMRSDNRMKYFL